MTKDSVLHVESYITRNGIMIRVDGKGYEIDFSEAVWDGVPESLKIVLCHNLAFADTQFLPVMLQKEKIVYHFPTPLLECFFFENQMYDLTNSEKSDGKKPLEYLQKFYNLEYEFDPGESALVDYTKIPNFSDARPSAILPFTFGKESLATAGVCRELGIEPIVVYCQEPAHQYEDSYKRHKLQDFTRNFGIRHYYIGNEPGLFRYGLAFNLDFPTELGWGAQTTILALLMLPFACFHKAQYILSGNEISCNEQEFVDGWKMYSAGYDQTSQWVKQQNNMIRLLTNSQCRVKSSLEPLDEINIFYLLHHRYPPFSSYQFSCTGQEPLYQDTQWCHRCYKCARMFLFARCCGIDPARIGFKKDLLNTEGLFENYFGTEYKSGSMQELDFSFYILHKKGISSPYVQKFEKEKLPSLKNPWGWYVEHYTHLKKTSNLPEEYQERMNALFIEELKSFQESVAVLG